MSRLYGDQQRQKANNIRENLIQELQDIYLKSFEEMQEAGARREMVEQKLEADATSWQPNYRKHWQQEHETQTQQIVATLAEAQAHIAAAIPAEAQAEAQPVMQEAAASLTREYAEFHVQSGA